MKLLASLSETEAEALLCDWQVWARDAQIAPLGEWFTWLVLAGRGFGKTRTGAEWVLQRVREGARRIALIAPTAADARDTMVEGEAGILARAHSSERPIYEPSKRRLTFPSGAIATTFSAEEPERLRGPQHDTAWCDELGAWRYAQDTWDMMLFGLRLGDPRICVTTTPRPIPLVRELLRDRTTVLTRGSTYDNASNLAKKFLSQLRRKHEGTRLGRQELFAEILEDTPGALWTLGLLEKNRVRVAPELARIVVAIDPAASDPTQAASSDDLAETGIVAAGVDAKGDGYVIRDASGSYSPAEWGERAVLVHDELDADRIIAESNQGGAMVEHVVRTAAEKLFREKKRSSPHIAVTLVHASRGKHTRAEPIAALDEQHRIHHVGFFADLESQMSTWVPGEKSPDRMDARVWALTHLMLSGPAAASYGDARKGLKAAPEASPARPQRVASRRHERDDDD